MWSRLSYLFAESFRGFFHSKFMSFVVIANIAIALFFVSAFATAFLNLNRAIAAAEERITFEVFLEDKAPDVEIMKRELLNTEGVKDATYISRQEAYELFKQEVGSEILTAVDGNPLPASFKLRISPLYRTPDKLSRLRGSLKDIPFVEEVSDVKDWVPKLQKVRTVFATVFLFASVVLCLAVFFMIFSTIRVTYLARRELLRVLELVGAPDYAITVPFVIEGALKGFLGGLLAWAMLAVTVTAVRHIFPDVVLYGRIGAALCGLGLFLGGAASTKSIHRTDGL